MTQQLTKDRARSPPLWLLELPQRLHITFHSCAAQVTAAVDAAVSENWFQRKPKQGREEEDELQ